jgi:hypothetical protein
LLGQNHDLDTRGQYHPIAHILWYWRAQCDWAIISSILSFNECTRLSMARIMMFMMLRVSIPGQTQIKVHIYAKTQ